MKRAIVTPAALDPAALAELKAWLGITQNGDDAQLAALLRMALELCEHFTGIMPLQQECETVLPVSSDWAALGPVPVQAITRIDGIPAEGARFVLPTDAYQIDLDAEGTGRVRVLSPGSAGRIAARFTAGLRFPTGCATASCGLPRTSTASVRIRDRPRRPLRWRRCGGRGGGSAWHERPVQRLGGFCPADRPRPSAG